MSEQSGKLFAKLVDTVKALRTPVTGCPWDLEQTHESIRKYLIEEAYEVLEAIENKDDQEFSSELGDLLLQVVLHSQIASDRSAFSIDTVVEKITEKMIRRHPHVFGDAQVEGSGEVLKNWERIKYDERQKKGEAQSASTEKESMLAGVPRQMPALLRAERLGEKANKVGFDWDSVAGVWSKVLEEQGELDREFQELMHSGEKPSAALKERLESELGDVLFSYSQLGRWLGLNAEDALKGCCDRFVARFSEMERVADRPLSEFTENELEAAWQQAKERISGKKGQP